MWIGVLIAVVAFGLAMLAVANLMPGFSFTHDEDPANKPIAVTQDPRVYGGHCVLCDAPIKRTAASSDDVVRELEHRIDRDTVVVAEWMDHPGQDPLERLHVVN